VEGRGGLEQRKAGAKQKKQPPTTITNNLPLVASLLALCSSPQAFTIDDSPPHPRPFINHNVPRWHDPKLRGPPPLPVQRGPQLVHDYGGYAEDEMEVRGELQIYAYSK